MKQRIVAFLGGILLLSILFAGSAMALNAQSNDAINVEENEVVDSSFYAAGQSITIAGTVNGDVFCAGQMVEVTGTVNGDILCGAQDVRITGTVKGDVRSAAQNITITGKVMGSASLVAQNITLEDTATINRDVTLAGQTARLGGEIGRDAVITTSSTIISGQVGRNVDAYTNTTTLQDGANIQGDFTYTSNNDAQIAANSEVKGATNHNFPPADEAEQPSWMSKVFNPLYMFFTLLILGGAALLVMPRWFKRTTSLMRRRVLSSLGLGLVTILLSPILAIIFFITLVGFPLGIVLLAGWLIILLASFVFVSFTVGEWIVRRISWITRAQEFASLFIGIVVLMVLTILPFIGWAFSIAALLWGTGGITLAVARSIRDQHRQEAKK